MSKLYEALRNSPVPSQTATNQLKQIKLRVGRRNYYEFALSPKKLSVVKSAVSRSYSRRQGDCIGFMSIRGGSGAPTICRDFAFAEAVNGVRTLLIDADSNAMPLRWYFFSDHRVRTLTSTGRDQWLDSICDDLTDNLDFMITGANTPQLDQHYTVAADQGIINTLRKTYDLSVFLLGNYLTDEHWIETARALDAVFIVIEADDDNLLNEAGESLNALGISLKGAVLYG